MTVAEAIAMVRSLLDEPSYEYHGSSGNRDTIFIDALTEACSTHAQETWWRGEKDATRPIWQEETIAMDAVGAVATSLPILLVDSVRSNLRSTAPAANNLLLYSHVYTEPDKFYRRRYKGVADTVPTGPISQGQKFVSRLEYTIDAGVVVVNRDLNMVYGNDNIVVCYLSVPTVSTTQTNQLPLAEYCHGAVCDLAASFLYRKEHPGDDRPQLGSMLDIDAVLAAFEGAKQGGMA
jgi:hypothetical protein